MSYSFTYDSLFDYEAASRFIDRLMKEYDLNSFVDLPCGGGKIMYELSLVSNYSLYGIDYSTEQITRAQKLCPEAYLECLNVFDEGWSHLPVRENEALFYIGNSFLNMFPECESYRLLTRVLECPRCKLCFIDVQDWHAVSNLFPVGHISKMSLPSNVDFEAETIAITKKERVVEFRFYKKNKLALKERKKFYNFNIESFLSEKMGGGESFKVVSSIPGNYRNSKIHKAFLLNS